MTTTKTTRPRPKSRASRWLEAVGVAKSILEEMQAKQDDLNSALAEIKDIQTEFQDWYDRMPENTQSGPTGEKLSAICELDFEQEFDFSSVEDVLNEAEAAEIPQGFGRD